jgi:hypothetical protein
VSSTTLSLLLLAHIGRRRIHVIESYERGVGSIVAIREAVGAVKPLAHFQQLTGAIARDAKEPRIERALAAKMW